MDDNALTARTADRVLQDVVPDGGVPTSLTILVTYLDPDNGEVRWSIFCPEIGDMNTPLPVTLGMLEMAKLTLMLSNKNIRKEVFGIDLGEGEG